MKNAVYIKRYISFCDVCLKKVQNNQPNLGFVELWWDTVIVYSADCLWSHDNRWYPEKWLPEDSTSYITSHAVLVSLCSVNSQTQWYSILKMEFRFTHISLGQATHISQGWKKLLIIIDLRTQVREKCWSNDHSTKYQLLNSIKF